jgi:chromosome segregation ATPase
VQLGSLSRQAARVPTLLGELEQAQDDLREVRGLLVETQNAFKLLMGTVQEKEVEAEAAEAQAEKLRAAVEAARRQQDETAAELEVGGEQIQSGGAAGGIYGGGPLSCSLHLLCRLQVQLP